MTIFGKVLIFLNLLAAGAFAYLTTQDWKARQELQWARFRGDMLLEGLPIEGAAVPPRPDDGEVPFNKYVPPAITSPSRCGAGRHLPRERGPRRRPQGQPDGRVNRLRKGER